MPVCLSTLCCFLGADSVAVIYYASNVFVSLGLTGGTIALLATGVTGVVFIVSTVPAMVSHLSWGIRYWTSTNIA
jgi:hypothetical protein